MANGLPSLDKLPRCSASQVSKRWSEVLQQVRKFGSVAVTRHSSIEMVLVDAAAYRRLTDDAGYSAVRSRSVLDQLDQAFEARLAALQQSSAAQQVAALFASQGRLKRQPKSGATY